MNLELEEVVESTSQNKMMPRYFLHMAYDGTNYHGWQRQKNGHSVQSEMETALTKLLKQEKVITTGCGRTDSGVHARDFYLHFNTFEEIENIPEILRKLNMMLPWDLAVFNLFRVHDKAHTRFDAIERTYEYHMHQVRDPFIHRFSKYYPWPLDVDAMNKAGEILKKYNDFASFSKTGGGQKTTICDLRAAYWETDGNRLKFTITADRFLRNMVRAVVGTMVDVGRGKLSLEGFEEVIHVGRRSKAGDSMAASGLHLVKIKYPYPLPPLQNLDADFSKSPVASI